MELEKGNVENTFIYINPPKGVWECSLVCKIIMDVFNIYSLFRIEGKNAFFNCFFLKEWTPDEVDILFKFIIDVDGIAFSDPSKKSNIGVGQYLTGLKAFADWLVDVDLPPFIREEIGFMDTGKIENAIDRYISWKKEETVDFENFFLQALKNYQSR